MPEQPTDPTARPDPAPDPNAECGADPGAASPASSAAAGARFARLRRLARSRALWVGMATALATGAVAWHRCGLAGCPSVARLASYQPGGASELFDRDGRKIGDLSPVQRQLIELARLPAYLPEAFIAVEDKRFRSHHGVDWRRVVGAMLANVRARSMKQGSSTITMQLARNVFPERIRARSRTIGRKLLEVRVAREIEKRFSKDEILEMYLNHIYFGAGAYGIEAASRQYFGKSAADLTLEQAALLAALPKGPTQYDPRQHVRRAKARRDMVLALMVEQGRVGAELAGKAGALPVRVRSASSNGTSPPRTAPYFIALVRALLEDELGEDLYARRLRIHTTLDTRLQKATEEELERQIRSVEAGAFGSFAGPTISRHQAGSPQTLYLQGAAVMMEVATGDVLALVGGRNASHSGFNRAMAAQRQVGSAFKPFVFAAALRRGWSPSSVLDDSPFRLVSGRQTWEPSNFDGEFVGPITFREALVYSRNVPTVRLAESVGEGHIARLARDAGLRGEIREAPVIALGVTEASPLELATAYTAFANDGQVVTPRLVVRVEDETGRVRWAPPVESRKVIEPAVADIMTDMLGDVIDRGTGRAVRATGYDGRAAGKTGTTNDGADAWFVGYTPRLIGSVWIGFDQPRAIAARATGGSLAAPVWGRIARRAGDWTGGRWTTSPDVIRVAIDPSTGLALEEGCRPRHGAATEELFLRGREPRATCPEHAGRSRSWLGRAIAWVGDLFENDTVGEEATRESARRYAENEQKDRRARREAPAQEETFYRERYGDNRSAAGELRRRSEPRWDDGGDWRGRRVDPEAWMDDLRRQMTESLNGLRPAERELLDSIDELIRALDDAGFEPRERQRLRQWAESLRESIRSRETSDDALVRRMLGEASRRVLPDAERRQRILEDVRDELRRAWSERRPDRRIADAR